jgi:ABC-type transport system involved in multi-copper enzyme maturation permease subunit
MAKLGEHFFYAVAGAQLVLILLVAPTLTAGMVCLDKVRGTLLHLLTTDLSNAEIILGKLATGVLAACGMVACGLPVLLLAMLLGGIDPEAVFGATLIMIGVALLGCSLALTLSVWATKTYAVLMTAYLAWGGGAAVAACLAVGGRHSAAVAGTCGPFLARIRSLCASGDHGLARCAALPCRSRGSVRRYGRVGGSSRSRGSRARAGYCPASGPAHRQGL